MMFFKRLFSRRSQNTQAREIQEIPDYTSNTGEAPVANVVEIPAIKFAVSRYVLTLGTFIAVVLFGAISVLGVPVNLLPTVNFPLLVVSTEYPGATPSDLDRRVSKIIEDAMNTVRNVKEVSSTSSGGFSSVVVTFQNGTSLEAASSDVSERVASVRDQLPAEAKAPIVQKFDSNSDPILSIAVSKPGADLRELYDWISRDLKPVLERVPGAAGVNISGAPKREIQVLLDPEKLSSYNITPAQVTLAMQAAQPDLPAGTVSSGGRQVSFAARTVITKVGELEQIFVDADRGVRVVDLGTVRDTASMATSYDRVNGQPVVLVSVRKTSIGNTVSVANGVKAALETVKKPVGLETRVTGDSSRSIADSVTDTAKEGIIVAVIVALVCLISLGKLNTAFAVVLAIPISLSAAPLVFALFGFSFNILTLLALIVAMGIVVDDSIVVAENVDRYRQMGYGPIESVLKGSSEIFSAVSAATFSLLAVLLPISFVPGLIGQYFREFGLGLAAAIFFSWLEALFFLTVRMAYTPDPKPTTWREAGRMIVSPLESARWVWQLLRRWYGIVAGLALTAYAFSSFGLIGLTTILAYPIILVIGHYLIRIFFAIVGAITNTLFHLWEAGLEKLRHAYARSLATGLRLSIPILIAAALFASSIAIVGPSLPFVLSPKQDTGRAQIQVTLPNGTDLNTTDQAARKLEAVLRARKDVKLVQTSVSDSNAFISLELVERNARQGLDAILDELDASVKKTFSSRPEIQAYVQREGGNSGGSDLRVNFNASTQELMLERLPKIVAALRAAPQFSSVRSSIQDTTIERVFKADPAQLAGSGLRADDIANSLRSSTEGEFAGNLRDKGESIRVRVRLEPSAVRDEQALLALPINAPNLNANLPLSEFGFFELRESPANISRLNKRYSASLDVNFKPGQTATQAEIETLLNSKGLLDDRVRIGGGSSLEDGALLQELALYGGIAVLLAFLLNYLVLGSQFNSFRYPIYLMLPVPLAIVGALWTLSFFGAGLDIITVLGMVILIGLVTKNAILLLDFVVERARVLPLREALIEAASLRLRPIIMTTLTVVVISFPLIFGGGEGAEFRRGLGIVILGGIVSSTILTLYVVPAAFYLFERKRFAVKAKTAISSPKVVPA
jgi:hydrophobic/amphiphilic exporter-1 (mainly G- bacteria), HAE1 family